ncbi:MAG: type II secretion system GspH family protein [bacterium]|nr:type II secretion system GspH family protein [bacterium]
MHPREHGFTLIELLIVTAFISVLAGVAVPNLLTSRAAANERAILATMRTIATAQAQSMAAGSVDVDNDGAGEALSLIELAGATNLRGSTVRLTPTSLTKGLGNAQTSGYVSNKGYLIGLYLPDSTGAGLLGTEANFPNVDPNLAENCWTCLAWPLTKGASGSAAFFLNQQGETLVCRTSNYSGTLAAPPAGAALTGVPATQISGGTLALGTVAADGNTWVAMQ